MSSFVGKRFIRKHKLFRELFRLSPPELLHWKGGSCKIFPARWIFIVPYFRCISRLSAPACYFFKFLPSEGNWIYRHITFCERYSFICPRRMVCLFLLNGSVWWQRWKNCESRTSLPIEHTNRLQLGYTFWPHAFVVLGNSTRRLPKQRRKIKKDPVLLDSSNISLLELIHTDFLAVSGDIISWK